MRGYFDGGMLWEFLSVKIKDCLEESLTYLFEKFYEREVCSPKLYPSFDVIMVIVDNWLEVLNKYFHFKIWCFVLMTRLPNDFGLCWNWTFIKSCLLWRKSSISTRGRMIKLIWNIFNKWNHHLWIFRLNSSSKMLKHIIKIRKIDIIWTLKKNENI
jgi:hypothetical protein